MRFKKIYVEITNRCNLNCSFCSKSNRVKKDMSILEFEKVISKIKDYTSYIYLHIKGEPLLHPDLEEILNICSKNDISVNITTNGINIKSSKDILLNQCVRQVNFSLHSYAFDNPDDYINSINDYVLSASSLGKYSVYRFWAFNGAYTENEKRFISNLSNLYNMDVLKLLENSDNIKLSDNVYINKSREFIWPDINNDYYNESSTCYALRDHIGILSDGTVVPCCLDGEGIISLGNIYTDDLESILKSERFKNMLEGFKNNKKCENLCRHCNFLDS